MSSIMSTGMILLDALRLYCKKRKIGPRQLSRFTGMTPMAASRFLGDITPDGDNMARILTWALQTKEKQEATRDHDTPRSVNLS